MTVVLRHICSYLDIYKEWLHKVKLVNASVALTLTKILL